MNRAILFFRLILICMMLSSLNGRDALAQTKETNPPPNFLFILVDDLGYKDLGCYGSTFYDTPNLDRLAGSGMQFMQGYAAHPVCSPTRAAIMTGQNPARVGITDWIPGGAGKIGRLIPPRDLNQLPLEQVTIAETLKGAGYKTFFAGKWHLGSTGFFPEDQGFDINKGGHHKGSPPGGYYAPYKNPKLSNGPNGEYLPDRLTDETIQFMEENKDSPFLAYLAYYTVHTPIQACNRHIAKYNAKAKTLELLPKEKASVPEHDTITRLRQDNTAYASMVHAMDENIGRLLKKLNELHLADNTIIIFTSDNGGLSTLSNKRGLGPTSIRPLRAGKGWCYEGGIRVPYLVRVPGVTRPGSRSEVPIYSADFYPTMLELAGIKSMPKQHSDGESFVGLLKGDKQLDRDFIVWHYPHYHGSSWRPGSAIRCGDYKLIEHYDYDKVELFNIPKDIGETRDLSKEMPEKTAQLRKMMHDYLKSVDAQMPSVNTRYNNK